jgi:N-acetylated-alpha-linked acidic dipeptidase
MRRFPSLPCLLPAAIFLLIGGAGAHTAVPEDSPASESQATGTNSAAPPLGFAPSSRAGQAHAEAHATAVPSPEAARTLLRTLTAEPHVAGTPADYKTAVFVRDKLREWGWKADLASLEVLLNYPSGPPSLSIESPIEKRLSLDEAPIATDKDSANSASFGAFHGYGVSGSALGQVVYVNYGTPQDFDAVEKMGIDIKNKIVLVRYGGLFRGLKVRNGQKRGAKGILIFSDPADDGFAKGDVYPGGKFRPGSAIQRGSVQFLSLGPGDPSTPLGPSVKGAKRLPFDEEDGFPLPGLNGESSVTDWERDSGLKRDDYFATIPSLPISYEAAHEIMKMIAGPAVPAGWQGGLPLPYHVGPGPVEVSMSVSMKYALKTIWNVIATIPGSVEPDRWVMVGNHRDAWVFGAVDPGSGSAATLEMCRALGSAVRNGWKPRRTILYASWDAEEYGLVGSTEWAEEHAQTIDEKAVLMLNVDAAVSGPTLEMSGVPSLRELVLDAAGAIVDPRTGKSLKADWTKSRRAAWAAQAPVVLGDPLWETGPSHDASAGHAANSADRLFFPQMGFLGSGSDFTAFVDHLAVPAIDVGFKGGYGVYHSIYDNFNWMEKFGDPEFLTHATAARLYTLIVMRAAAADVVPLKFVPYGLALREHVDQLRKIHFQRVRKLDRASSAITQEFAGLSGLVEAVQAFQQQAELLDRSTEMAAARDGIAHDRLAKLNDALSRVERAFLLEKGLPGRPWFKHAIYAPGLTTGYACWPLPALRQDLEEHKPLELAKDLVVAIDRIKHATAALKSARAAADKALESHSATERSSVQTDH